MDISEAKQIAKDCSGGKIKKLIECLDWKASDLGEMYDKLMAAYDVLVLNGCYTESEAIDAVIG